MTVSDYLQKNSPEKRKANRWQEPGSSKCLFVPKIEECNNDCEGSDEEMEPDTDYSVSVPMQFEQLTRELEVKVYTGLPSPETFQFLFHYLSEKARSVQYWRCGKQTTKEAPQPPSPFQLATGFTKGRPEPERKLRLEQEFLLTLMKLRLALLTIDLGFRFHVSAITVSSIFITWIKLMSKELSVLIVWPSRQQVKKSHHVSSCYGGRASDIFIVRNSGFLNMIESYDEIMADRGFKIREDLAKLCIPPSCASSMQMLPHDVRETSNITNVRIYVEQAIGRLKVFLLLNNELPISLLPLADDIVRVCCALCNLLPPLCI